MSWCNFFALGELIDNYALVQWGQFALAMFGGAWLAGTYINGKNSVALHELKHSILSGFVGNKAKGIIVKKKTGLFSYEYTQKTKHFNTFIALAPYWFPLFTILALGASLAAFWGEHQRICILVGLAFGADALLNIRDISPIQTDITTIRGGYNIGLLYIVLMNFVIISTLLAYVAHGSFGFAYIFDELYTFILYFAAHFRG